MTPDFWYKVRGAGILIGYPFALLFGFLGMVAIAYVCWWATAGLYGLLWHLILE